MFVMKGMALGVVMLIVFTLAYFKACGMLGSEGAVTHAVFRSLTLGNYLYWTAAGLFVALGIVIVAIWPVRVS